MNYPREKPTLSLMASYDDVVRSQRTLFNQFNGKLAVFYFEKPISMLLFIECLDAPLTLANDYGITLQKYNETMNELSLKNQENEELLKQVNVLNIRLNSVRQAFTKKLSDYDNLMKDYKQMATKLAMVRTLLSDKHIRDLKHYDSVQSILKDLKELPNSSTSESSRSEDSTVINVSYNQARGNQNSQNLGRNSSINRSQGDDQTSNVTRKRIFENRPLGNTNEIESPRPPIQHTKDKMIRFAFPRQDQRYHKLQMKRVYKVNYTCASCNKKISFCSRAVFCLHCDSIFHTNCPQQLNVPCVRQ